jgi:hypothetical protein
MKHEIARFSTYSIPLVVSSLLFAAGLKAGEDVDLTMIAESEGTVRIINTRGEVEIYGWDKDEIRVEGELDDLAEELIFDVDGSRARIEVRLPRSNINWGDGSDLEIYVPERSSVIFEGVSTDTTIENIAGGLRLRSVSGDIFIDSVATQVMVKSVSGDIEVKESSGDANISTVSGEIEVQMASDTIILDTVSGEIDAELEMFSRLRANAVSGDIHIEGQLMDKGDIDISSVSGDVRLSLVTPVNAKLNIETGPGGEIVNQLSDHEPTDKFPAHMKLEAELGDGAGDIRMRTVSGDVRIEG